MLLKWDLLLLGFISEKPFLIQLSSFVPIRLHSFLWKKKVTRRTWHENILFLPVRYLFSSAFVVGDDAVVDVKNSFIYGYFTNFFSFCFSPFRYRRENNRLTSDQTRLQATYREMENQSKILSEKIARQQVCRCYKTRSSFAIVVLCSVLACVIFVSQTTLQGKIEREITEKKLTEDQVNNQRSYNWIFPNTLTVFKCFNWFSNECVCRFQPQSVFPAL